MRKERLVSSYSIAYIVATNAIILGLIWWVLQDRAYRDAYWRGMGFIPSTSYWPFSYVTSAVRGSTYIQGTLTLDWVQVLAVLLIAIDLSFLIGVLRRRSRLEGTASTSQVTTLKRAD